MKGGNVMSNRSNSEKVNFYIDTTMLESEDANITNKTAAITKALKSAYGSKKDFVSFVRTEMLQKLSITTDILFRDIITRSKKAQLIYNTCLQMGGCRILLARGTEIKYKDNFMDWNGRSSGFSFSFFIPEDTKVIFEHHKNDFNSDTLCAFIRL